FRGLSGTDGSGIWPCQSPESGRKSDRTSGDKKFACAARSALIVLRRISPASQPGLGPPGLVVPQIFRKGQSENQPGLLALPYLYGAESSGRRGGRERRPDSLKISCCKTGSVSDRPVRKASVNLKLRMRKTWSIRKGSYEHRDC